MRILSPVFDFDAFLKAVALALLLCLPVLTWGCRERTAPPAGADTRLVILNPAMAHIAIALGGESAIVGRHGADTLLSPDLPVAATWGEIDYEVLGRLRPTDVFLQPGPEGVPPTLRDAARTFNFQVHALPLLTLDDIRGAVHAIDQVLHPAPDPDDRARRLLDRLDEAWRPRPEIARAAGATLVLAWTDPPGVMGPGSFHYQMLASMGFEMIPADGAPYIEWSAERVVREAPETIILMLPGADASKGLELLGPIRGGRTPAERDGHVIIITDVNCHLPGPALADVAEDIVRQVEVWASE